MAFVYVVICCVVGFAVGGITGEGPGAAFGSIIVDQGVPTFVDDDSGHYTPNQAHVLQVEAELQRQGVPTDGITFKWHLLPKW